MSDESKKNEQEIMSFMGDGPMESKRSNIGNGSNINAWEVPLPSDDENE